MMLICCKRGTKDTKETVKLINLHISYTCPYYKRYMTLTLFIRFIDQHVMFLIHLYTLSFHHMLEVFGLRINQG